MWYIDNLPFKPADLSLILLLMLTVHTKGSITLQKLLRKYFIKFPTFTVNKK